MPIVHDNRNMRPDLVEPPVANVDDIFAAADAQMEQQRRKQMFTPSRKKIQWKKRIKRTVIATGLLSVLIIIISGILAANYSYNLMVEELQTQVLAEVTNIKSTLAAKEESELTEEDLLLLAIFDIISEEDIVRMVDSATSIEEIIYMIRTQNVDINRYLTLEQQKELEELLTQYAKDLEVRAQELEKQSLEAAETISTEETLSPNIENNNLEVDKTDETDASEIIN